MVVVKAKIPLKSCFKSKANLYSIHIFNTIYKLILTINEEWL